MQLHLERLPGYETLMVALLHGPDVSRGYLMGTLGVEKKPINDRRLVVGSCNHVSYKGDTLLVGELKPTCE